jgi:hypothetical protein
MDRTNRHLAVLVAALVLHAAGAGFADPPASIAAEGEPISARASFEAFARSWMARTRARSDQDRANPRLVPGARALIASYREVGADFRTELQSTGHRDTPYVGVLRYSENVVECADLRGTGCHVVSTLPVTEVFQLRDGRWVY